MYETLREAFSERSSTPVANAPQSALKQFIFTHAVLIAGAVINVLSNVAKTFSASLSVGRLEVSYRKPSIAIKSRRWLVSFGEMVLEPGAQQTFQLQPQLLYKAERIVATGETSGVFVQGIFVGQRSQIPTFQNPIPLDALKPGVLNDVQFDTCDPALFITLQIQNTSDSTKRCALTMSGRAVF